MRKIIIIVLLNIIFMQSSHCMKTIKDLWQNFKAYNATPLQKSLIEKWKEDYNEGGADMIFFKRTQNPDQLNPYRFEYKQAGGEITEELAKILKVNVNFRNNLIKETDGLYQHIFAFFIQKNKDLIEAYLHVLAKHFNPQDFKITDQESDELQNFARQQQSMVCKIHLQVKKEYLIRFIARLFEEFENNKILQNIYRFKFTKDIDAKIHQAGEYEDKAVPIIVIYLPNNYLPTQKDRNAYLDPFIWAFVQLVDKFCKDYNVKIKDIAYGVTPRFNYKINEVVYIGGGDGDYKLGFLKSLGNEKFEAFKTSRNVENSFYSNDLCFVKGFEYAWDPTRFSLLNLTLTNLKESLTDLSNKLHILNEKLAIVKDNLK